MKQVHAPASRAGKPFSPRPATAPRDPEERRKGVDSHGSTKGKSGAAPPLPALKRPGSRANSASGTVGALLCSLGFSLAIAAGPAYGQSVAVYDNLNPERDPDPNAGRWRFWATLPTEGHSQPFLTGDSDNVSSITLDVMLREPGG